MFSFASLASGRVQTVIGVVIFASKKVYRPILATQRRSREWFWRVHSSWVNPRGEHVKVWNKLQVRGRLRGQLV